MPDQSWLEMRRAAIGGWQTYASAALRKEIEARMIATINARPIPEEGSMTINARLEDPLVAKTWSRGDFAARLNARIESGELEIPELYADMIVDSITAQHASPLAQQTDDDWEMVDAILDAALGDLGGQGNG